MLKKKSSKKTDSKDFSALDSAVSELSKQTEALLGSFKDTESEKKLKPNLPKKQTVGHPRAKHFDIIHDPKNTSKLHATLRAVPKVKEIDTELPVPAKQAQEAELKESKTALVLPHKEGSLSTQAKTVQYKSKPEKADEVSNEDAVAVKQLTKTDATSALSFEEADQEHSKEPAAQDKSQATESDTKSAEPTDSHQKQTEVPISANDESATDSENDGSSVAAAESATEKPIDKSDVSKDTAGSIEEPEENEKTEALESSAYRGELYANNLVKEAEPKGYQANDDEEKPALFDTEEYHPELHDWSKLEHKSSTSWLLLILVLVAAGALAYYVLTGQKIPFIS